MPNSAIPTPPVTNWPIYWFSVLEKAVDHGDYEKAAQATRELRRLGVEVKYRPHSIEREAANE